MTFMDLCIRYEIKPSEYFNKIDDCVEKWHNCPESTESLSDYLGMTEKEYSVWTINPQLLFAIINSRLLGRYLCTRQFPWDESKGKAIHTDFIITDKFEDKETGHIYAKYKCCDCNHEWEQEVI